MLNNIGTIVALYVIFRILDILLQGGKRYPFRGAYAFLVVIGLIFLLLVGISLLSLWLTGASQLGLPSR